MNTEYIQNLRYKLQKRVRRLNSSEHAIFNSVLKQFWGFLKANPVLLGIVEQLETSNSEVQEDVEKILNGQALVFNEEVENAAACFFVIKACAESDKDNLVINIARKYSNETSFNDILESFKDIFVEPLYDYIDEQLDDKGAILALLKKYKQKCEWFQREYLYDLWSNSSKRGEKLLALHLYEYLHEQGVNFTIEPSSISGEADLVSSQEGEEPLIADAKIFNPSKSKGKTYISQGFGQIYTYALDFNEQSGFLIIYKTCEEDLKFSLAEKSQSIPFVTYNNKTIFLLVIDIYPHEQSASKRGVLKSIEITEEDLIKLQKESSE